MVLDKIFIRILTLFKINPESKFGKIIIQFLKFCVVGVSNTIIFYLTYIFAVWIINYRFDYIVGNIVGFVVSVLWSFYWNNRLVFKNEDKKRNVFRSLVKTFLVYSFTGIIISNVVSYVLIDVAGFSKIIVPIINAAIGVPINFLLNKFWTFNNINKENNLEKN